MRTEFDIVAQLPLGQPISGEGVNITVHVAEAVVVERPDDALRQLRMDILDHVPHLDPYRGHVALFGLGEQIHVDGGLPRNGDALRVVKLLKLFQLFLDALGDLIDGVLDSCAGPLRRDDHGFDGELRVFFTAEVDIGHDARDHAHDHEVPDDRRVIERHSGEIELPLSVLI